MNYTYFGFYDVDPFSWQHAYSMFDDVASASNNTPTFGQIFPR